MSNNRNGVGRQILEGIGDILMTILRTFASAVSMLAAFCFVGAILGGIGGAIYGMPVIAAALVGAIAGFALAIALRVLFLTDL